MRDSRPNPNAKSSWRRNQPPRFVRPIRLIRECRDDKQAIALIGRFDRVACRKVLDNLHCFESSVAREWLVKHIYGRLEELE